MELKDFLHRVNTYLNPSNDIKEWEDSEELFQDEDNLD